MSPVERALNLTDGSTLHRFLIAAIDDRGQHFWSRVTSTLSFANGDRFFSGDPLVGPFGLRCRELYDDLGRLVARLVSESRVHGADFTSLNFYLESRHGKEG